MNSKLIAEQFRQFRVISSPTSIYLEVGEIGEPRSTLMDTERTCDTEETQDRTRDPGTDRWQC